MTLHDAASTITICITIFPLVLFSSHETGFHHFAIFRAIEGPIFPFILHLFGLFFQIQFIEIRLIWFIFKRQYFTRLHYTAILLLFLMFSQF